jgi:hypothetical protein
MDVGVLEEPPQVGPYKKRRTSLASKGHLPPRDPPLESCQVAGLPEPCAGPTFVFLFIEVPKIAHSTMDPQCLEGLFDVASNSLSRPTRVVPMEGTLSYATVVYI